MTVPVPRGSTAYFLGRLMSLKWAFQVVLVVKNLPANAGDTDSIPGSGRSPGGGHGNPLQYSCMKNLMDRAAWQAMVIGSQRVRHAT